MRSLFMLLSLLFAGLVASALVADDAKQRLSPLQDYVGSWRGVGQLRRGSNDGAWVEQSDWAFRFAKDSTGLKFVARDGKYFDEGVLTPGVKPATFQLIATRQAPPARCVYTGALDDQARLVLSADEPVDGLPGRISVRLVAGGDRMLVLYEQKSAVSDRYVRLAEVGYTRKGSNFGKGVSFVECIVTGGKGTIPVTFEGKTYYVCCTGCRDYFNENPAEALAEYAARKAKEKQDQEAAENKAE